MCLIHHVTNYHATKEKFVPRSGGNECVEHKEYKIEIKLLEQPKDYGAAKPKSMCVPLMNP